MKKIIMGLLVAATFVFVSCGGSDVKRNSQGRAYEISAIMSRQVWDGEVGQALRGVFQDPVHMVNRTEPIYDVYMVPPSGVTTMIEQQRNLIIVQVDLQFSQPSITAREDIFAAPQLVVDIVGPDEFTVQSYIWGNEQQLQQIFNIAERNRFIATIERTPDVILQEEIEEKFGFEMKFPKGFRIRNNDIPDFMWISQSYRQGAEQGVIVYSYPYSGRENFEMDALLQHRNEFVKNIPGPSDGSYMTTSPAIQSELKHIRIHGRFWSELIGFWDVENDYMGGPFRSYSTLDTENNRVICIDEYVFAPGITQRNFVRQLETLMFTVRFPGDNIIAGEN